MQRKSPGSACTYACADVVSGGARNECMCQSNGTLYFWKTEELLLCTNHMIKRFRTIGERLRLAPPWNPRNGPDRRKLIPMSRHDWNKRIRRSAPTRQQPVRAPSGGSQCSGCGTSIRGTARLSKKVTFSCLDCRCKASKDATAQAMKEAGKAKIAQAKQAGAALGDSEAGVRGARKRPPKRKVHSKYGQDACVLTYVHPSMQDHYHPIRFVLFLVRLLAYL